MKLGGLRVFSCCTQGRVDRQKVLFGRVVLDRKRSAATVVEERFGLPLNQRCVEPVGKTIGPLWR